MAETTTQPAEVTEQVKGSVRFGTGQIGAPTPMFATLIFRWVLYIVNLGNIAIITFTHIPADVKLEIVSISNFATLAVHSASKMFGVKLPDNSETNKP